MPPNGILSAALILLLAIVGLWDVYATTFLGPSSTVSAVIHAWSKQFPVLPLAVGLLLGHLFWPISKSPDGNLSLPLNGGK